MARESDTLLVSSGFLRAPASLSNGRYIHDEEGGSSDGKENDGQECPTLRHFSYQHKFSAKTMLPRTGRHLDDDDDVIDSNPVARSYVGIVGSQRVAMGAAVLVLVSIGLLSTPDSIGASGTLTALRDLIGPRQAYFRTAPSNNTQGQEGKYGPGKDNKVVLSLDPTLFFYGMTDRKNTTIAAAAATTANAVSALSSAPLESMTYSSDPEPLSNLSPQALGFNSHPRPESSSPGRVFGPWQDGATMSQPLPTNNWYMNLLLGDNINSKADEGTGSLHENNRVYTIPYVVDFVGPIPGMRLNFPHALAMDRIVQMTSVAKHGLTIGTVKNDGVDARYKVDAEMEPRQLGVALRWTKNKDPNHGVHHRRNFVPTMKATIMRGMPYGTVQYSPGIIPAVSSQIMVHEPPLLDRKARLKCGSFDKVAAAPTMQVRSEISIVFRESDFTWLLFFSRPVNVSCYEDYFELEPLPPGVVNKRVREAFQLRVVGDGSGQGEKDPVIIRAALGNNCTLGNNPQYCDFVGGKPRDQNTYQKLLRDHSDIYPSRPGVEYEFPESHFGQGGKDVEYALVHFDWGPRSMKLDTLALMGSMKREEEGSGHKEKASEREVEEGGSVGDNSLLADHTDTESKEWTERHEVSWWDEAPPGATIDDMTQHSFSRFLAMELLMYSLPYHVDRFLPTTTSSNTFTGHCSASLHGQACLVRGGEWVMREDLDGIPNFAAPRPPHSSAIPRLAESIREDIEYEIPEYYMRGVGDTYFSGKMLARLGRVVMIASELRGLAETPDCDKFDLPAGEETEAATELAKVVDACREADLPSDETMQRALSRLRSGVEVWLNGTAETRFVYDVAWGGLVSCGCWFSHDEDGRAMCDNVYPNCPTFMDPGLDFGHGFYNDHHFHHGYHIYAAAVISNFDHEWGRQNFEKVLLLIRDIANPSVHDKHFPAFRHKDWFLGSSWASGIATIGGQPYPNGRNQESSSEAIAAYEAIGLWGAVMVKAWGDGRSTTTSYNGFAKVAGRVREMGRLLTSTELRAADRYWHVLHGDAETEHHGRGRMYPKSYTPGVVGMMWDTMVEFQTWFGNAPFLSYGIQLLPLTAVGERRDGLEWAKQIYGKYSDACEGNSMCEEQGWSILQFAILATVGHRAKALKRALALPTKVFATAGGCGHSMSNTLWYIATRPDVESPLSLGDRPVTMPTSAPVLGDETPLAVSEHHETGSILQCGCPGGDCSPTVLGTDAGGYTCQQRITFLINAKGQSEVNACYQVSGIEFPEECGMCNPAQCGMKVAEPLSDEEACPPCPEEICNDSELNQCPPWGAAPYLCYDGPNRGGCSLTPWPLVRDVSKGGVCFECCKIEPACGGWRRF